MMGITRRSFVLSGIALAGCQATNTASTNARSLTDKYDGKYDLYVGRLGRNTAFYQRTGNAGREEELARLTLVADGGVLRVINVKDYTNAGPNFGDFEGAFYADDTLHMKFTTSFLFNQRSTYTMSFDVNVDDSLKNGKWLQIEPPGWDKNNDAIIRIGKIG